MTPTLPTRASPNLPGCWQILHWPNGHPTSRVRDPNSVTALPLRDFNPLSLVQWTPNGVHRRITALWTGRHPHTAVTHHPAVLGRLALPRHGTLRLADKPGRACGPDTEFAARQPPGPWPNAAQYRSASADALRALHGRCKQHCLTVGASRGFQLPRSPGWPSRQSLPFCAAGVRQRFRPTPCTLML